MSSASEEEDSDDSESRDVSPNVCTNCLSNSSKEWHQNNNLLICNDCKAHQKKFGELPKQQLPQQTQIQSPAQSQSQPVPPTPQSIPSPTQSSQFVFKTDEDALTNGKHNMRTRRSKEKNKDLVRNNSKSSEPSSPERCDQISRSEQISPNINGLESITIEKSNSNDTNPKKRICSEFEENDETNTEISQIKRKKLSDEEHAFSPSQPEVNPPIISEDSVTNNGKEEVELESTNSPKSPISSQTEPPLINDEENANMTDASNVCKSVTDSENKDVDKNECDTNVTSVNLLTITKLEPAEDIKQMPIEAKSPEEPLITPKLEPPSSPKSPPIQTSSLPTSGLPVPSTQKPNINSTPPLMCIKEEVTYPKSPQTAGSQLLGSTTTDNTLNDRVYPFMSSQQFNAIPHRMTSPIITHSSTELVNENKDNSNASFVPKVVKDRYSPKSYPLITSLPESPNIPITVTSGISMDPSMQTSFSTPKTPSEQRLPAVTASVSHSSSQLSNIQSQSHSSLTSPTLSPHIMPPSMPPYFPTSWSPYSSRCLPPHPLGFPTGPFVPPMVGSGVQMPGQQSIREMSVSKSKSPITSQPSRVSHSPSQYSGVPHISRHDNKYDMTSSNRDVDRHRDRDRDHHEEDEPEPQPYHHSRGPSPEPKIEDSECHRSQSAMLVLITFNYSIGQIHRHVHIQIFIKF